MSRKRTLLVVQILSFLLVSLLGVATGYLTNDAAGLPQGFRVLQRSALPLAGVMLLLIIGLMVWQHVAEERLSSLNRPVWVSDRSPFPGLEAFTEQDSAVFFGRDAEIAELLERLNPVVAARANRMVTVVGPSGVGKSSLVEAGIVPRLRQRRGGWIVVPPVVPGDRPVHSLARCLAAADTRHSAGGVRAQLTTDMAFLPRFLDGLRIARGRPAGSVLLTVDQAEELITLSGQVERDAFLSLLAGALERDLRLWIILIMRSEFLTGFLGTEQARLFRDPFVVGTLGRGALLEVIEQPAQRAGLVFDPPVLPQLMVGEAGAGDALPLLAYALQELYLAAGPARVVTAGEYQRLGGVTGVVTRQADRVTAELRAVDGGDRVLETLLKFVTIGDSEPTRRRVRRSALSAAERRVVEAFISARLLTSSGEGDNAVLDVAHEALFRAWAPLRQAIQACADQLRWRADLERWATDWDRSGRQDAYLLRDGRLRAAQQWAAAAAGQLAGLPLVAQFVASSNQADHSTMQRLSENVARQALNSVDRDPDYSLLLALTALEECAPTELALRALTAALVASQVRIVLRGHDDDVQGVAWSPDGGRLATASADRTARIWDAGNGNELTALRGHHDYVTGLAWSPDGGRLATASADRTARIWDAEGGCELMVLHGHGRWVWGVAWSPDGGRLATASADRTARIWDAEGGSELMVLHGHDGRVRSVAWSPDGGRLATASADRTARIWDAEGGSELVVLRGHAAEVRSVAWSPDGKRLAAASSDGIVRICEGGSGKELLVLRGHGAEVRSVAWSPDGKRLATGSGDHSARIWDADSGRELIALHGHDKRVWGVAWSPDGKRLATGSRDRTARIWDIESGSQLLVVLRGHNGKVRGVAWSPDGGRLATASADRTARIWDADHGRELATLHGHSDEVRAVAWSPDGRRLATASNDRTARIWDADHGGGHVVLGGHDSWVDGIAWSPDGKRLATTSDDRTVRIWDAGHGGELAALHGHSDEIRAVAWSPDGTRLASASDDRTARIWDAGHGQEIVTLHGHCDYVRAVAWSPDGTQLATASDDRTVRIWDAGHGGELATLHGHAGEVWAVAWSPDGKSLASASADRTIRIWDTHSGAQIVVGAHIAPVEGVSWSPDGTRVASSSYDGTSRIWNATISIAELVANAHQRVSRELTAEERRDLMLPPASG